MRDLILIHGALGAAKEFDRLIPHLENNFKVHAFDLSGHGQKKTERKFTMQLFAQDLKDFILKKKLVKPQIFGYSMGGYAAYTLAMTESDILGDIMSLGTKLKWDPLIAKLETGKLNPTKIEEKVPKFAAYLNSIQDDWKQNMLKTVELMHGLGNGGAATLEDFAKIKNKCFIGLGDMDAMVSCAETLDVDAALVNSHYYKLPNSEHPLPKLDMKVLADKIIEFLT